MSSLGSIADSVSDIDLNPFGYTPPPDLLTKEPIVPKLPWQRHDDDENDKDETLLGATVDYVVETAVDTALGVVGIDSGWIELGVEAWEEHGDEIKAKGQELVERAKDAPNEIKRGFKRLMDEFRDW